MSNPEYIFNGTAVDGGQCTDLDQIDLDRSESFLGDEDRRVSFTTNETAETSVHELNCFGFDPNNF